MPEFLFKIRTHGTVKAAAETAMREVIASDIQPILTEGRSKIEIDTQTLFKILR